MEEAEEARLARDSALAGQRELQREAEVRGGMEGRGAAPWQGSGSSSGRLRLALGWGGGVTP